MEPYWWEKEWLAFDIETTGEPGSDPSNVYADAHRPVQVGAAVFCRGEQKARYSIPVNPGCPIDPAATAIHGITDEMVADAPSIEVAVKRLIRLGQHHDILVAYNGMAFDDRILRRVGGQAWCDFSDARLLLDPFVIVRMDAIGRYWKGKGRHRLGSVAEKFQVLGDEKLHGASGDALLAARVLWWMICDEEFGPVVKGLGDSLDQVHDALLVQAGKQEAQFQEWLAKQPKKQEGGGNG